MKFKEALIKVKNWFKYNNWEGCEETDPCCSMPPISKQKKIVVKKFQAPSKVKGFKTFKIRKIVNVLSHEVEQDIKAKDIENLLNINKNVYWTVIEVPKRIRKKQQILDLPEVLL